MVRPTIIEKSPAHKKVHIFFYNETTRQDENAVFENITALDAIDQLGVKVKNIRLIKVKITK